MKTFKKSTFLGEFLFTEEYIIRVAKASIPQSIKNDYGDMILAGIGYNAFCEHFDKLQGNNDYIRIEYTDSYSCCVQVFSAKELAEKIKNKIFHIEMMVE